MSGVQVDAEINGLFNDMKMRSTHKFVFFNIEGKKKIVADVCGNPCKTETKEEDEAQFNRMKEQLTNEPRYILYDFGFMKKDGSCLLYTSPSPRDRQKSRMPSSA